MIKINLLGEESVIDYTAIYWLIGYLASLLVCGLVLFLLNSSIVSSIKELRNRAETLDAQLAKLKIVTKEVRNLETKKEELRDKLAVIAVLKRNKTGPVRVMDDLNLALPERAWLTNVKEKDGLLRIQGMALDNQTIAAFMKGLEGSEYFSDVDLVETKQVEWKKARIKEFILQTKVNYAGKIAAAAAQAAEPEELNRRAEVR